MITLKEMRDQIIDDLDLLEETFVDIPEINKWINEGIRVAEASIHTIYEDYFLVEADPLVITEGNSKIDYPSDIYANKIRKIIYSDGLGHSCTHEVRRIKSLLDATNRDLYDAQSSDTILEWTPINDATNGRKIRLFPSSGRSGHLIIWYIRNAKQLALDTDECDIDEFQRFVIQYAKTQAYLKDGDPRADDSKTLQEEFLQSMITTLSNMIPDEDNEIMTDMTHYQDSVGQLDFQ